MLKRIITLGLIGTCLCQYAQEEQQEQYYNKDGGYHRVPPQILSHKQSQNHDGQFKYAFATENGLLQGESVSPDGSRTGAYAYVDPTGRKISVKYIAGKEGFKILEGDHIPKPPPQLAVNPHPGYQSFGGPPDDGSYRPELPKPAYPPIKGAFTQFKPELPKPIYTPPKIAVPKGALFQQFRAGPEIGPQLFNKPPYGNSFIPEKANEVQQYVAPSYRPEDRETDYTDEPGKANSFGSGYAFEFGG